MEETFNMSSCPSCGTNVQGDESLCHHCGYRLILENNGVEKKVQEKPIVAENNVETASGINLFDEDIQTLDDSSDSVTINTERQQSKENNVHPEISTEIIPDLGNPIKKKRKLIPSIIILIVLLAIICFASAIMQKKGIIQIKLLNFLISVDQPKTLSVIISKNYYVVYSTYLNGNSKEIAISNVIKKTDSKNRMVFVITDFKEKLLKLYPKDFNKFTCPTVIKSNTFVDAFNARETTRKKFMQNKFDFRIIELN